MAVIALTKKNFEQEVLHAKHPVLIDFWAPWCGPCRTMGGVIEELGEELKQVKIAKVNIDEEAELAAAFGILSIPTLVLMEGGEVRKTSIGLRSKRDIVGMF